MNTPHHPGGNVEGPEGGRSSHNQAGHDPYHQYQQQPQQQWTYPQYQQYPQHQGQPFAQDPWGQYYQQHPQGYPEPGAHQPKKKSRWKVLLIALLGVVVLVAGGIIAIPVIANIGDVEIKNTKASLGYAVPKDGWRKSELVLPMAEGEWGGLVEYHNTTCEGPNGTAGVVMGQIASSPYPRSGATSTPESAVQSVYKQLLRWMYGGNVEAKPGLVQTVTVDGIQGARLDITLIGTVPECEHRFDTNGPRDTMTIMAFPTKNAQGQPIMSMVYFNFTNQPFGEKDAFPKSEQKEAVRSLSILGR